MLNLSRLLTLPFGYHDYIWIDVIFIHETPKAILIEFDHRRAWLPKAWIVRIKYCKGPKAVKIKISWYHWAKKFQ